MCNNILSYHCYLKAHGEKSISEYSLPHLRNVLTKEDNSHNHLWSENFEFFSCKHHLNKLPCFSGAYKALLSWRVVPKSFMM